MTSQHLDFLAHLDRESRRFLDVLRDADPAAQVPTCPEWSADDLLWHLTEVQYFWGSIVNGRLQEPGGVPDLDRPTDHAGLVELFATQAARLSRALECAEPETPVYMWAEDKTVGYIRRRQAHEALIHRVDAELATGQVTPLDPALASDGIEEALGIMYGGCPPWGSFAPDGARLLVVAEDTGASFTVAFGQFTGTDPDGKSYDEPDLNLVTSPGPAPLATVTGRAGDLDAWLWRRRGTEGLTVAGDASAFDRLEALIANGIS